MAERIGLIGFVNTEEILADTIRTQTPNVVIDGYEVFPNEAFGRAVDNRYPLYGFNDQEGFGLHNIDRLTQIPEIPYDAVNLGPIPAVFITEDVLKEAGANYVGPTKAELVYELDKTKIADIFPENAKVLPPTIILDSGDISAIKSAIESLGGDVVFKFVGEYPKYYSDSETRRVRMIEEFHDRYELEEFVRNSIDASGTVVLQKKIDGQQFSYSCLVDRNGSIFRLGEDICYKHRLDGEQGPLCDGTGALAINNTLPGVLADSDITQIEQDIVRPYTEYLQNALRRAPRTFLNLDLIKDKSGRIYLLEVNGREPGGHTMANLLSGLVTPLAEVLQATQEGRLSELTPRFKQGASVVVSAYPDNFPYPFESDDARPSLVIPKLKQIDKVRMYTGWVDVVEDKEDAVVARPHLSPTMLFVSHAPSVEAARKEVYERMAQVVPDGFAYRKDIGL